MPGVDWSPDPPGVEAPDDAELGSGVLGVGSGVSVDSGVTVGVGLTVGGGVLGVGLGVLPVLRRRGVGDGSGAVGCCGQVVLGVVAIIGAAVWGDGETLTSGTTTAAATTEEVSAVAAIAGCAAMIPRGRCSQAAPRTAPTAPTAAALPPRIKVKRRTGRSSGGFGKNLASNSSARARSAAPSARRCAADSAISDAWASAVAPSAHRPCPLFRSSAIRRCSSW